MPKPIPWTPQQDEIILEHRAAGRSWDFISDLIGISRYTVAERGAVIGAELPSRNAANDRSDERLPMPAGHSLSWNAINAGTSIAGAAYPEYRLATVRIPMLRG